MLTQYAIILIFIHIFYLPLLQSAESASLTIKTINLLSMYGLDEASLPENIEECPSIRFDQSAIHKNSQIMVPLNHGQYINIPLTTEDPISNVLLKDSIGKTQNNNQFFILASYRHRLSAGSISYPKYFDASHLLWQEKNVDLTTLQPIVSLHFHQFYYADKKYVCRYLGNLKDLTNKLNPLLNLSVENKLYPMPQKDKLIFLIAAHIVSNPQLAPKYISSMPTLKKEDYPQILNHTRLALHYNDITSAKMLLETISSCSPDALFLLSTLNEAASNHLFPSPEVLAQCIWRAWLKKEDGMISLGNAYLYKGLDQKNSEHITLAHNYHMEAFKRYKSADALFFFMRTLYYMNNEMRQSHHTSTALQEYANLFCETLYSNPRLQELTQIMSADFARMLPTIERFCHKNQ